MKQLLLFAVAFSLFTSCQKGDISSFDKYLKGKKNKDGNLKLNIDGLEDLGPSARYEGWLIIEGQPISTGIFSVDSKGKLNTTVFKVPELALDNASLFVLTVEPYPDNNPGPSDVHLLGGEFSNGSKSASLSVGHPAALGNDYTKAEGKFIIGTPTDGPNTFEESGIWFLSLASGSPAPGLKLPMLPAGWKYEGWVLLNGRPVSTGTFLYTDMSDESGVFSGPLPSPPFPGEDFLNNAPSGFTFPTTLRGSTVVVSIEPYPDNSPAPFLLKPLYTGVSDNAPLFTDIMLKQNLGSFPTGTIHKTK